MPRLRIENPTHIDRHTAHEYLPPESARVMRRLNTRRTGQLARGDGTVRPNFTSGSNTTQISCGLFSLESGRKTLVVQNSAGSLDAFMDPRPAYLPGDFV